MQKKSSIKAIQINPNAWQAYFIIGNIYDDQQNYEKAEENYLKSIALGGKKASGAYNNLSRLRILQGKYKEAIELVRKGLEEGDRPIARSGLFKNLGWAQYKLSNYEEAKKNLIKSSDLNPEEATPYCLLAQIYESERNLEKAAELWAGCGRTKSTLPEVIDWQNIVQQRILNNLY